MCWAALPCILSISYVIRCEGVCGGTVELEGSGRSRQGLLEGKCGDDRIVSVRIVTVVLDYAAVPEAVEDKAMYLG